MEQRPRNTKSTIAEWLPAIWGLMTILLLVAIVIYINIIPQWVFITAMSIWFVVFIGSMVYQQITWRSNIERNKKLRSEVLKNLACCKYEWSDPKIHGISDIYELELTERTDVNEYALTIHSTHLGILIGFKGRNIDLVHSVIDDIFGYKINIDFKEPDLFKNLYKKD